MSTKHESVESKSFYQRHPILSTLGFVTLAFVGGAAGGAIVGGAAGLASGTAGSLFVLKSATTKGAAATLAAFAPAAKAGALCL